MSSGSSRGSSGGSGRRVNRPTPSRYGRGPGGTWTGSSHWSPYGRRERVWPKVLLVVSVVGILIFGSVLVADRLAGLGVANRMDNIGNADVPSSSPTLPTGQAVGGSPVLGG